MKAKKFLKVLVKILLILLGIILVFGCVLAILNSISIKSSMKIIENVTPVEYEDPLIPSLEDGYYTFTTDRDLKIMQLSDVHIGGGILSKNKDAMALNAVVAMIKEEKPDVVMMTGDIVYPVPVQSGTFNNKSGAKIISSLMERLGVYWCPTFGNHDTESYTLFSRESIGKFYEQEELGYCLFQSGPEEVDGVGNYVVNVKNSQGEITQSLINLDSNAYVDSLLGLLGVVWDYDTIHENQVEWYENTLKDIQQKNNGVMPKSLAFFHMPIPEHLEAWTEYSENNYQNTENTIYNYGEAGEVDRVVYTSEENYGFFDKCAELGSTQGMWFGHDHMNNISFTYKGISMAYSYTIDYLAYTGVKSFGAQRGCTIINVSPDGSFTSHLENYYQDKYVGFMEKEKVSMGSYYEER